MKRKLLFSFSFQPDLSSDDNDRFIRSSSLTNPQLKQNFIQSVTDLDELDDSQQQKESSQQDLMPIVQTSQCSSSSSKQSSRMDSPVLSTNSQSSARVMTLLNHEVMQLPVYLEREILIKENFNQLSM
jgi:hypothetical protein